MNTRKLNRLRGDLPGIGCLLVTLLLVGLALYGWVSNLIALAHSNFEPLTGMVVVRIIGVFAVPVGVVMGYIS